MESIHLTSHVQPEWTATLSASARAQVLTRQAADRPHNAMLLRADIHSLFDDYQWSIWVRRSYPTFCSLIFVAV